MQIASMTPLLLMYTDMMLSIKQGNIHGKTSNSKPLFLLSVLNLIENNRLTENQLIFDNSELKKQFERLYLRHNNYKTGCNESTYTKPFFHLHSAKFYHLIWKDGVMPPSNSRTPSAKFLREHLMYAKFDDELWELLQDAESRDYLKQRIIDRYLTQQD